MNWEQEHKNRIQANARKIDLIYEKAVKEAALVGATVSNFNPDRPFSFADYPGTKYRIDKMVTMMNHEIQTVIVSGSTFEWQQANNQNNLLTKGILGLNRPARTQLDLFAPPPEAETNPAMKRLFNNNNDARDAFINRKEGGMHLSDRVWKHTAQFKTELEMSLDDGIRNGQPAAKMARDARQFLQEPDRVYKRFQMHLKDANGNPVLDRLGNKITIKQERRRYVDPTTGAVTWRVEQTRYKPGQGVYRSSRKNAQRLTRSENSMAYRTADHTRIQQLDFVVGFEVKLSGSHKVLDICDTLQGRYPKEFLYKGWHTHCLCPVTFILKTPEELAIDTERILNGQPTNGESINQVKAVPEDFTRWTADNTARVQRANTVPYFIQDNFKAGDITKGLSYPASQQAKAAQAAIQAAEENAVIQEAIRKEAAKVIALRELQAAQDLMQAQLEAAARATAEALRIEQEAQAETARAEAFANSPAGRAVAKGSRKLAEAEALGIEGRAVNGLRAAITATPPNPATIQYNIDQVNIAIRRHREEIARAARLATKAETARIAEEARIIEAARVAELARMEALRVAEAARIAEVARVAEVTRVAEIARAAEVARVAEASRLASVARTINAESRATTDPPAADAALQANWRRKAAAKLVEAQNLGVTGISVDRTIEALANPTTPWNRLRYCVVQLSISIAAARTAGATPQATTTASSTATVTGAQTNRVRDALLSAPITAKTTEAQLMTILKAKLEANRALRFEGNYMDWWTGFTNGNAGLSNHTRREELLRGIARMDEFATSHATGVWTDAAKSHFRGVMPKVPLPAGMIKPTGTFKLDKATESKLKSLGWSGSDAPKYAFNELMEGYDMVQFDKEVSELAKKYGIRISSKTMRMNGNNFTFTISNGESDDTKQFYLKRTFSRNANGLKSVSHDYLTVPEKLQGQNLTKELFDSLYTQYKATGVAEMKVHANISVGSYAWGRYGFMADVKHGGSEQKHEIARFFSNAKTSNNTKEMDKIIAYINKTPNGTPVDMHQVSEMLGAKDPLMHKHWYGFLDLTNPARRKIFETYLAKRK